nr:MAG TPA: hypothetical protein [Caudoviricetes sp.]
MDSTMRHIHKPRASIIFAMGDKTTCSLIEAYKWFEQGRSVLVTFKDEVIGKLAMGEPIERLDDIYYIDPKEPYGTIHYVKKQDCYYNNLPYGLLESVGA